MGRRKLKAVIIGMGRMGNTRYNAMKSNGGYEIVALCDTNGKLLSGFNEAKYEDWKQCINDCQADVVVVCTVNKYIPDIVCYSLRQGCAVFSEKPPGKSVKDAIKMRNTCAETGGLLKFGFNHRVHNSIIEAKALIKSNILGDIVCLRGVYGKAGNSNFGAEWRNDISVSGGGILIDQGIHMIDLMCYLSGDKFHVLNSEVENLVWHDIETEDSAIAVLKSEDGKTAILHSSAIQWKHKFDLDIIFTNGYMALNGLITSTRSYGEETISYYRKDLNAIDGRLGRPKEHTLCFDTDNSWEIEMTDFYNDILNNKITNGTADEAVNVMKLIGEIY